VTKKGETYTKISVDLQRWAEEYMRINNLIRQRELAERIFAEDGTPIHRARVNDILKGRANSLKLLQLIVNSIYKGDYLAMSPYALDEAGTRTLVRLSFEKTLNTNEIKKVLGFKQMIEKAIAQKRIDVLRDCKETIEKKLRNSVK
jgi:predicted XRE-type DNA-binding protein